MDRPLLNDWMSPPANRWSFSHVRQLVPTAPITASRADPATWAKRTGLLTDALGGLAAAEGSLVRHLIDTSADAFVVVHDGRLMVEWYREEHSASDVHLAFSVSKSITGLLAGALAGAQLLDLDAEVAVYVPEAAGSGFESAKVRHLLDMSTAVDFAEDHNGSSGEMDRYRRAMGWSPHASNEHLRAFLCSLSATGRHGDRYCYVSPNIDMLGWVCERAAGGPFAEALARYLWGPLGAGDRADITVDAIGSARASGGISASARDLARVGQLLLDGGRGVVPGWFVDDLFGGGDTTLWAAGSDADWLPPGASYRSCWYNSGGDSETVHAIGVHGQSIHVDRRRQTVIVRQSHWPEADDLQLWRRTLSVAQELARAIAD